MARPNKAQITYEVDGVESVLRFHSVIAEEHTATASITKFPVQSGFNISNHSIKMNRVVSITGIVTNSQVVGGETFNEFDDSKNVVRLMFSVLKDLVGGAVPCEVVTNYGDYSPVIFTKFKTKLVAGKTDVMEFTMSGEEVQLGSTINGTKPTLLVFTPLDVTQTEARKAELTSAGFDVSDTAILSEAEVNLNESFQVESVDDLGSKSITTYENVHKDSTSDVTSMLVSTSNTEVAGIASVADLTGAVKEELGLPDISLSGPSSLSSCFLSGADSLATETINEEIDTVFGKLETSLYGGKYSIIGVKGNQSLGQELLGVGADCLVVGATGSSTLHDSVSDVTGIGNIPSVGDVLNGASATSGSSLTTITKIECGC